MGIWRAASSGDDVNALDVDVQNQLVYTADDYGAMKCFNYPCVVKKAGSYSYKGHSSHVMNVKVLYSNNSRNTSVISVGSNDNSAISWKVRPIQVSY